MDALAPARDVVQPGDTLVWPAPAHAPLDERLLDAMSSALAYWLTGEVEKDARVRFALARGDGYYFHIEEA